MQNCYECAKKMWTGSQYWEGNRRWHQCRNCGHWQLEVPPQGLRIPAKVLYFDIETSLIEMTVKVFDMRVHSGWLDWHDITRPFYVISWAAAWVDEHEPRVHSGAVTAYEARRRSDKRHLRRLWDMMDLADYCVGHNSKSFDHKKVETRFLLNNMGAPSEYKTRDTLTMARKHFKAESNALDYWMRLIKGQQKEHMVREDWEAANKGDQKTINKMERYNRGDVMSGIQLLKAFMAHIESSGCKRLFP